MPVSVRRIAGKYRIVGPDGKIEMTPQGHARDGGGHATRAEAARQQRAINMHVMDKAWVEVQKAQVSLDAAFSRARSGA